MERKKVFKIVWDRNALDNFKEMKQVYIDECTIVGHTTSGKPISKTGLKKRIKDAEARIDKGEFVSQEDLEKEIELW